MRGKGLILTSLFTEIIEIIRFLVINGLTKEYQGSAALPECSAQESYYAFPSSPLITMLSLACCEVKTSERWEYVKSVYLLAK